MNATKRKLKAVFLQLPLYQRVFKNFERYVQNLPMAAAMMKAMAIKNGLQNDVDIEIMDKIDNSFSGDARLLRLLREKSPDLLCLSLYSWNAKRSLYIASEIKKCLPECKVIVGGPEVTADYSSYLFKDDTVDIAVAGEGELIFSDLLKSFLGGGEAYEKVRGIMFRRDGALNINPPAAPIMDINEIPSPYLSGVLDPSDYYTMWLETARWCPMRCTYCAHHNRFGGKNAFSSVERIGEELKLAKSKNIESIGFIDSCINVSPDFLGICEVIKKADPDRKMAIGAQMIAARVNEETAKLCASCNIKFIEVGLQSTDPEVLANVRRKENLAKFLRGVRILLATGAEVYMDLIIGLPGQTLDTLNRSVQFLVNNRLNTHSAVNLLSVFPSSDLRKEKEKWGLKTQEEPPYRILETSTLSFEDIKAGYRRCRSILGKGESLGYYYPVMVTHATGILPQKKKSAPGSVKLETGDMSSRPVTRIVMDMTDGRAPEKSWRAWADNVSSEVAHTLVLWFKTRDPAKDTDFIGRCLKDLSGKNPLNVWNIILETDAVVTSDMLNKLQAFISYRPNVLDYDHYYHLTDLEKDYFRISDQFFILHPYSRSMAEKAHIFKEANRKTLWYVPVSSTDDIPKVTGALRADTAPSLVLDFSLEADGNLIFNTLTTCKAQNIRQNPVWITNWVIQYVWESMNISSDKQVTILGADEHILHFGPGGEAAQIVFNRTDLFDEVRKLFFLLKPAEGPV